MATVLETTLVRTPGICGGRLRIDGTRLTVNQIVTLYHQGMSAEQIAQAYPHRGLSAIYTVLAWYHENKEAFDAELGAEAAAEEQAIAEIEASRNQ